MSRWLSLIILLPFLSFGQSFAPEPGQPGTTAIHKDSSIIQFWADSVSVIRGFLDVAQPGIGNATYGVESDATGPADGISVVSLGDRGKAVISFPYPISNGQGPDFAIFENGFIDHYMEFAFVEVSSDGINFYRFDAVSEIPTDIQLTNFSTSNCGYVNNLAGKYRAEYGTPFDLEELAGVSGLDVNNITHVKLIDVVGSVDPNWGSFDSQGNIINDPYPTEFESCGFDLDAIAVINSPYSSIDEIEKGMSVYPNPFDSKITVENADYVIIRDIKGKTVFAQSLLNTSIVETTDFTKGIYLVEVHYGDYQKVFKLMKHE
jgi:hypothetical protein